MNIKYLRENKNITQAALGDLLQLKANTISNYENRVSSPDIDTLIAISKYFDVNIDDLLMRDIKNIKFQTKESSSKQSDFVPLNVPQRVHLIQKKGDFPVVNDPQASYLSAIPTGALEQSKLVFVVNDKMSPLIEKGAYILAYKAAKKQVFVNQVGVLETIDNTTIGRISTDHESGFFVVQFEDTAYPPKLIKIDDVQETWIGLMKCTLIGK